VYKEIGKVYREISKRATLNICIAVAKKLKDIPDYVREEYDVRVSENTIIAIIKQLIELTSFNTLLAIAIIIKGWEGWTKNKKGEKKNE